MKYIEFLQKIDKPDFNVDRDLKYLPADEQNYLMLNAPRLVAFGGKQTFLNLLAEETGVVSPEMMSHEDRDNAIRANITAEYKRVDDDITKSPMLHKVLTSWWEAQLAAMAVGDGKLAIEIDALNPCAGEYGLTLDRMISLASTSSRGELMHYLLHESPQKEEVFQKLQPVMENGKMDISRAMRQISGSFENHAALHEYYKALNHEQLVDLFTKCPKLIQCNSYTDTAAVVALDYYPRELIGTKRRPTDQLDRYNTIYHDDGSLLYAACLSGRADIVKEIMDKYPNEYAHHEMRSYNSSVYMKAALDNSHIDCVEALMQGLGKAETEEQYSTYLNMLETGVNRHDDKLADMALKVLDPVRDRIPEYDRGKFDWLKLMAHPELATEESIKAVVEQQHSREFLKDAFHSKDPELLGKYARAVPEQYAKSVDSIARSHILTPAMKKRLAETAPEAVRARVEESLSREPRGTGEKYAFDRFVSTRERWQQAFGSEEWVKKLPHAVTRNGPEGFNYGLYKEMLPAMKTAVLLENGEGADANANKLARLFANRSKVDMYFNKFAYRPSHQAIHDTLLFEIPKEGSFDQKSWQDFALRDGMGPKATRIIALAPKIQEGFIAGRKSEGRPFGKWENADKTDFQRLQIDQLIDIAGKVAYAQREENPALAKLCIELGVEEKTFQDALGLIKNAGTTKTTPDITVDGKSLGYPGFTFKRLKADDPRNAFIGKMVNCCNYLGGHTDAMARAQIKNQDCSLYVLVDKHDEPVAKCTGWMSEKGNLVFNAWERLSPSCDKFCEPFLLSAAVQAMEKQPGIQRVTLGTNKGAAPFALVAEPEKPPHAENASQDAEKQYEVANRRELQKAKDRVAEITPAKKPVAEKPKPEPEPPTMAPDLQNIMDIYALRTGSMAQQGNRSGSYSLS